MKAYSSFSQLCHSPMLRCATVMLVTLAWISVAGCRTMSTIHDAAMNGDLKTVKALLKGNPDLVFNKNKLGGTPLHFAAIGSNKAVAALLQARGADVNARDNIGRTPLRTAVANEHEDSAELLRQHGGQE